MFVGTAQFCLRKNQINCLLSMNKRARRCVFGTVCKINMTGLSHFGVKTCIKQTHTISLVLNMFKADNCLRTC